jgi:hypothetical protein
MDGKRPASLWCAEWNRAGGPLRRRLMCTTPLTPQAQISRRRVSRLLRPRRRAERRCEADPCGDAQRNLSRLDEAGRQQPQDQGSSPARRSCRNARILRSFRQPLPRRRHRVLLLRPARFRLQRSTGRARALGGPALRRRGRTGPRGAGARSRRSLHPRPLVGAGSWRSSTRSSISNT